jgi:hypothetical protein
MQLKKRTDRHADPLFEHGVRIQKADTQASGQLTPDGGFTPAGQAD